MAKALPAALTALLLATTANGAVVSPLKKQAIAGVESRARLAQQMTDKYADGNRIADGAALMTGTTVEHEVLGTAAPRHFNRPIAEAAYANIQAVGLPRWTPDEQAFAKAVQTEIKADKTDGLATKLDKLEAPVETPKSGGSDDIGDVSWTVPTITLRYPANIPGIPGHSWPNAIAMATPIAHDGVVAGTKVMAMTTLDLLTSPKLLADARTYFKTVQTRDEHYLPVIDATDKPHSEMNAEVMARFRPAMSKFYYDGDEISDVSGPARHQMADACEACRNGKVADQHVIPAKAGTQTIVTPDRGFRRDNVFLSA